MGDRGANKSGAWSARKEKGSPAALAFLVWAIRSLGYAPLRFLLAPIALYYCVFAPKARRASQDYLARVGAARGSAEPVRLRDTYRHVYAFAEGILDRLSLWSGAIDDFEVAIHGREHAEKMLADGGGGFLVGAHIGSFDVLRAVAREAQVPVNVVVYSGNAEQINRAFETLDPTLNMRVITLESGSAGTIFEIRRCVERGELVAVLGDRIRPGIRNRVAYADFLGERAAFPCGPLLLPMMLRVPAVLGIAIRNGPRRYEIFMEPLASGEAVPAAERTRAVQDRVEHYASRLEHYCKKAPLQWFNFYDFWAEVDDTRR